MCYMDVQQSGGRRRPAAGRREKPRRGAPWNPANDPSRVGVRELRQNLSVYLDRVKEGETLTVTEHGRIVAVLRPPMGGDTAIDRLIADGRVVPPTSPLSARAAPRRVALTQPMSDILDDIRQDRL